MGFLSGLFKRKKGGTKLGNMLRGVASTATGGLLGSGAGLKAWEESQNLSEIQDLKMQLMKANQPNKGFQAGQNFVTKVALPLTEGGQPNPTIGQSVLTESLKKNWYFIAGGVLALVAGMYFIMKPKSKKVK